MSGTASQLHIKDNVPHTIFTVKLSENAKLKDNQHKNNKKDMAITHSVCMHTELKITSMVMSLKVLRHEVKKRLGDKETT
jgi:hypothetical protein